MILKKIATQQISDNMEEIIDNVVYDDISVLRKVTGLYNLKSVIEENLSFKELERVYDFCQEVYFKDYNRTSLEHICDFMGEVLNCDNDFSEEFGIEKFTVDNLHTVLHREFLEAMQNNSPTQVYEVFFDRLHKKKQSLENSKTGEQIQIPKASFNIAEIIQDIKPTIMEDYTVEDLKDLEHYLESMDGNQIGNNVINEADISSALCNFILNDNVKFTDILKYVDIETFTYSIISNDAEKILNEIGCAYREQYKDLTEKDFDYIMERLTSQGNILEYLRETLQDNKDLVLALVEKNVDSIQWISKRLMSDKDVVLAAVKQDDCIYQWLVNDDFKAKYGDKSTEFISNVELENCFDENGNVISFSTGSDGMDMDMGM